MKPPALIAALLVVVVSAVAEPVREEGGWSADLLSQILKADVPKPEPRSAAAEMVLHTYHLTHLQVGEAGRAKNVMAILAKLLPPGATMNADITANSVHVLATPAAHQAIWEYLSAVDTAEPAANRGRDAVPDEIKQALTRLARSSDQSGEVLAAVAALKTEVSRELADIDSRQHRHAWRIATTAGLLLIVIAATFGWMFRRQAAQPAVPASVALVPEQLATALNPVHDRMRADMLGLLNEVAIKLQAQHNEQQKLVREQQLQLDDARQALAAERRQFITEAGTMVVEAVGRVDATTARLEKQQDKVAELVQELQSTVRELDETKDTLRGKQVELERERAKIAALSLLLEEGGVCAIDDGAAPANGHRTAPANGGAPSVGSGRLDPFMPCTTTTVPIIRSATPSPLRFRFLPPDHPES